MKEDKKENMDMQTSVLKTPMTQRRLGTTILKTYRSEADYLQIIPNTRQPRLGPKEDVELQREIEANQGIFEPLLVEPHPEDETKYRIIDGERRWTNCKILVEVHKKTQYRTLPIEVVHRTLTDEERWRVWIYIHRQRKEWETKEKEMAAVSLVSYTNRATAANILGITVRELDKLCDIYELSEKITNLPEPGASISYAREIKNIAKNLLTPEVENIVVKKVNEGLITNSKDIRKLRKVLRDDAAKEVFQKDGTSVDEAYSKISEAFEDLSDQSLTHDLASLIMVIKSRPWSQLITLKEDKDFIKTLSEAEKLLHDLKKTVAAS